MESANVVMPQIDTELSALDPKTFDRWHDDKCNKIMVAASNIKCKFFTYGVAAKILNCYLKAIYINELDRYFFLHPPVDRLLLTQLSEVGKSDFFRRYKHFAAKGWSKFDKDDYQSVIEMIKAQLFPDNNLWKIEKHWKGFR